jgi:hypothetical protein
VNGGESLRGGYYHNILGPSGKLPLNLVSLPRKMGLTNPRRSLWREIFVLSAAYKRASLAIDGVESVFTSIVGNGERTPLRGESNIGENTCVAMLR